MRLIRRVQRKGWILAFGALLVALLAAGCGQTAPAPSPMEVTHASYLDLSGNIADLRSRVTEWQKGDEGSLKIAEEKLERIETVLGATGWPKSMAAAVARTKAAVAPMARSLKAQDRAGAEAASKEFGDASHDVTHAFYGDWLPGGGLKGARAQAGSVQKQGQAVASGSHAHDSAGGVRVAPDEGPNWPVIGGFVLALALVIGVAGATKPKAATRATAARLPEGGEA